jgi:hypothetical protein
MNELSSELSRPKKVEPNAGRGRLLPVLTLVLVAIVVGLPLFSGRVLAGQDIVNYLIHAQQTAENLRQGVFMPAWSGGYNSDYGSPVLLFFPPVTSYVGSMVVLVGLPVSLGVGWLALIGLLCSGLAIFGWLRSAGFERSALPAAVIYMIAPYRLIDLYLRSALAEHWAFIWPPLILWIGSSTRLRPMNRAALTALAVAGLLLTNIPLAVLFGLGLAVWYFVSGSLQSHRFEVAVGACLAFGLAAFSLVPMALAPSLLDLDACFGKAVTAFRPSSNTLFAAGFLDGGLNLVFSWTVVATFALVVVAWALLDGSSRKSSGTRWLMVAAVACFVSTTGPAGSIWDATPIVSKLQFPWRMAALLTLLAVILVARLRPHRAWIVVGLAGLLAVPFAGWDRTTPRSTFQSEEPSHRDTPGTVFPDPLTAWEAGSGGWYWRHHQLAELCLLPRTMPRTMLREFAGARQEEYDDIRGRPAVILEEKSAPVRVLEWAQTHRSIEVGPSAGGTLQWRVLWFPDMQVMIDGKEAPLSVDDPTGLAVHVIPAGTHRVELRWSAFSSLRFARLLSVVSLVLIISLVILGFTRRRSKID